MKTKPLPPLEELNRLFEYQDGRLVRKVAIRSFKAGKGQDAGSISSGYLHVRIHGTRYLAHRIIWKMVHGTEPGPYLDHIDGNGLNNRIENLQEVSQSHNVRRSKKTGSVCVTRSGKFECRIRVNWKQKHIGTFDTREQAQQAIYDYCDNNNIRYD